MLLVWVLDVERLVCLYVQLQVLVMWCSKLPLFTLVLHRNRHVMVISKDVHKQCGELPQDTCSHHLACASLTALCITRCLLIFWDQLLCVCLQNSPTWTRAFIVIIPSHSCSYLNITLIRCALDATIYSLLLFQPSFVLTAFAETKLTLWLKLLCSPQ